MTERDRTEEDVHPVAMLLPWYRTGKLKEEEHRQVSEHLAHCRQCQKELEELTWLRTAVGTAYAEQTGPSPEVFRRVMERIEVASRPEQTEKDAAQAASPGWLDRVTTGMRDLYAPKWAPVLASGLIVAQLAALVWVMNRSERPAAQSGPVIERSVPRPVSRLQVSFQADAPAREIERVIRSIKGRIVDGPRAGGLSFILEIPVTGQAEIDKVVNELRSQAGIVQAAEAADL